MDKEKIHKLVKRKKLEDALKAELIGTTSERVTRYLELDFIKVTPNEHFASISAECIHLYRDGYFFACIALCQAVAEALVRFLCIRSGFKPDKVFEKNIDTLFRRKIMPECYDLFKETWKGRDDYHHLKPNVPTERIELQDIAKNKLIALHEAESIIFTFEIVDGSIKPKYPKYWPETHNGLMQVYLRLE